MKLRIAWYPWIPLIAGILCGLSAVFFMQLYIQQAVDKQVVTAPPQTLQATRPVVVANRQLTPGEPVVIEALSLRHVHPSGLAVDVFTPEQLDLILGQVVQHAVQSGQPIQAVHLADQTHSRLADTLEVGTRAFTLSVSAENSNAGLIQLGDKVDFYDMSAASPRPVASSVAVIATGPEFQSSHSQRDSDGWQNDTYRTLTFAINSAQLAVFSQLQRQQQLGFWLRSGVDQELAVIPRAPVEWIVGRQLDVHHTTPELWQ